MEGLAFWLAVEQGPLSSAPVWGPSVFRSSHDALTPSHAWDTCESPFCWQTKVPCLLKDSCDRIGPTPLPNSKSNDHWHYLHLLKLFGLAPGVLSHICSSGGQSRGSWRPGTLQLHLPQTLPQEGTSVSLCPSHQLCDWLPSTFSLTRQRERKCTGERWRAAVGKSVTLKQCSLWKVWAKHICCELAQNQLVRGWEDTQKWRNLSPLNSCQQKRQTTSAWGYSFGLQ